MKTNNKHKIVVAITGASGAIYAKVLLDKLAQLQQVNADAETQIETVGIVMSDNAKDVWKFELGDAGYEKLPFTVYSKTDFFAVSSILNFLLFL